MARAGRTALTQRQQGGAQDAHSLSMRLCAWGPISDGRMAGRIRTAHVRAALVDLGIAPEPAILESVYDVWFGQWRLESSEVEGQSVEDVVHVAPASSAKALKRR